MDYPALSPTTLKFQVNVKISESPDITFLEVHLSKFISKFSTCKAPSVQHLTEVI